MLGWALVIVCGLPGSGKTTLAKTLAAERPAIRFGPDEWMHALGVNLWDADVRAQVEALQWSVAKELMALGGSVIIEWRTWARGEREALRAEAVALGAATELVYLNVDDDELWRRIHGRGLEDPPVKRADLRAWRELFDAPDSEEVARYDASSTPT